MDAASSENFEIICGNETRSKQPLKKYKDAIERQGFFGRLFVEYRGCPRGPMGLSIEPLEDSVLYMQEIVDIEGDRWIPVQADALKNLVSEYKKLKTMLNTIQEGLGNNAGQETPGAGRRI